MTVEYAGGCICGAVRYRCSAEAIFAANCHCRDCQRATGSAFAAMLFVPRQSVTISGDVTYYAVTGDSGNPVRRGFCPRCGARLFSIPSPEILLADLLAISAGSLDEPSRYQPTMDIYTMSAQAWDPMNPELSKFTTFPQAS